MTARDERKGSTATKAYSSTARFSVLLLTQEFINIIFDLAK